MGNYLYSECSICGSWGGHNIMCRKFYYEKETKMETKVSFNNFVTNNFSIREREEMENLPFSEVLKKLNNAAKLFENGLRDGSGREPVQKQWRAQDSSVEKKLLMGIENAEGETYHMDNTVNSPSHYNKGSIEVIDFIEDQGMGEDFCAGNAIKYLCRANHKGNKLEDLKKAKWYVNRLVQIEMKKVDNEQYQGSSRQ